MTAFAEMLVYTANDYTYENQAVTFIDNHDVTRFRFIQQDDRPYHAAIAALMTVAAFLTFTTVQSNTSAQRTAEPGASTWGLYPTSGKQQPHS